MKNTQSEVAGASTIHRIRVGEAPPECLRIGDWIVEPSINRLRRGRQEARLEPKSMDLLVYLASHTNQVVSRSELEASVWQGTVVGYDTLTGAIKKLRSALGDDRAHPRYIETLSKRGYRLVAPVQGWAAPSPLPAARAANRAGSVKPAEQPETALATRIYLVRHGATELTAEERFARSAGVSLSAEGRRQVAALAERLCGDRLDAVYASPMAPLLETAQIIASLHSLEALTEPGLREIDFGHWQGRTRDEVEAKYPEEHAAWLEDPLTVAPRGGESGIQVLARALPVMLRIVQQHEHHSVLVVSGEGTNLLLMSTLLGFDARGCRDRLEQSPAALNILDFASLTCARLRVSNDVSHYEALPPRLLQRRRSGGWCRSDC